MKKTNEIETTELILQIEALSECVASMIEAAQVDDDPDSESAINKAMALAYLLMDKAQELANRT